jgi:hypothetical protein
MQRQLCFSKLVCFFPWLAGRFHNFELTQNREKTRNGLNTDGRGRSLKTYKKRETLHRFKEGIEILGIHTCPD